MKEILKGLPQIDAQFEYDDTTEYANKLLDELLRYFTLNQISSHTGISRRLLSYMRHRGISTYPMQLSLEILSGSKVLVEL